MLLVFANCKQDGGVTEGGDKPTAKKYKVELVQSEGGTVTVFPNIPNDLMVEESKELTFTAKEDKDYKIGKWEITGGTSAGGGQDGAKTAKVRITSDVKVKVNFTKNIFKHMVTIEKTEGGTVTVASELPNDGLLAENTELTFTATGHNGYKVDRWEITAGVLIEGSTDGSTTAKIKVTKDVKVKVTFRAKRKYKVTTSVLGVKRYGTFTTNLTNLNKVEEDTIIVFNANPDSKYREVEEWQLNNSVIQNKDNEGEVKKNYECKVTANLNMKVKFEDYAKVPYNDIPTYLAGNATYTDMTNYIEIKGETPVNAFKGSGREDSGDLGNKIKSQLTKKVSLKINYPAELKSMYGCFNGCENLISLETLPESVTDLKYCFRKCVSLSEAPTLPKNVTDMYGTFSLCAKLVTVPNIPKGVTTLFECFASCVELQTVPPIPSTVKTMMFCFEHCSKLRAVVLQCDYNPNICSEGGNSFANMFRNCNSLTEGSIQVVNTYYTNYITADALTTMAVPGADETEQRKKFKSYNP